MDFTTAEIKEIRENLPTAVVVKIFKKYWQVHDAQDHMKWLDRDLKKDMVQDYHKRITNRSEARALIASMMPQLQYREFLRLQNEGVTFEMTDQPAYSPIPELNDHDPLSIAISINTPLGKRPALNDEFFKKVGTIESPLMDLQSALKTRAEEWADGIPNGRALPAGKSDVNPRGYHKAWFSVMTQLTQVVPLQDNGDAVQQDTSGIPPPEVTALYGTRNGWNWDFTDPRHHLHKSRGHHYWSDWHLLWNRVVDYKRVGNTITWRFRKRKPGSSWFYTMRPHSANTAPRVLGSVNKSSAKFKEVPKVKVLPDHGGF
jgi:hypothetical protein